MNTPSLLLFLNLLDYAFFLSRSIVGGPRSQNSSRDNSWNREDRRQTFGPRSSHERDNPMTRSDITPRPSEEFRTPAPPTPIKKIKEMSEEEMESKAKNILQEYLNIRDLAVSILYNFLCKCTYNY